jgi:hypothetical protein
LPGKALRTHFGFERAGLRVNNCWLYEPIPGLDGSTRQHSDLLLDLVAEAQRSGEIRADASAGFVTKLLRLSFLHELGTVYAPAEATSPAEHVGQGVDPLLEGLAGPGWRPGTNP